jgi:hypothetical protein
LTCALLLPAFPALRAAGAGVAPVASLGSLLGAPRVEILRAELNGVPPT